MMIADERVRNLQGDSGEQASVLSGLLTSQWQLMVRALDCLEQGILILAHNGSVLYYNAAYLRLRAIPSSRIVEYVREELDGRRDLQALLRAGTLACDKTAVVERQLRKEGLMVIRDAVGALQGVIVSVLPPAGTGRPVDRGTSRRVTSKLEGDPRWLTRCSFADIIGVSPGLTQAKELALRAAHGRSSVLVLGESGTGKELFAHAIHAASTRMDCPFVPVDCSAIPRELLEAELFGYAPGAFTGASKEGKPGKFELAHRGTILLDEIGEMPLELQSKLLRVLQERQITRVGGTAQITVDFAVIAATNRDLEHLVAQGRFRRDLMYRLDIVRIEIPPLRERPEDVPPLLDYYWDRKQRELGSTATLSADALRMLEAYPWPGNVRELANLVERLLVTVVKPVIEPADLPPVFAQAQAGPLCFTPFLLTLVSANAERRTLERALQQAKGNRNKVAQLVGLSRATLYRKLKRYGLG